MNEDMFQKILKELLNGASVRELQEKYDFDRNRFKERIDREYPIGTPRREQIEKQLYDNKKNSATIIIPERKLEPLVVRVLEGNILLEEAARQCGVYIQTFKEKMVEYINGSNDSELKRKYIAYQSRVNPDYSFINFKALFIEMLKLDMSQSEIAGVYGIPARTVSRELEKFKDAKDFGEIYRMAKESAKRKITKKTFTEYERILMDLILNKYKEGAVIIPNAISKEEREYKAAKELLEKAQNIEGTNQEKAKALGISVSTLRRAKVKVEQYEDLEKDERNI